MDEPYPIRDVDRDGWKPYRAEYLGTKTKRWLEAPDGRRWLFKFRRRPEVGDDWAEKVTCEIAGLLGLPHAHVELASHASSAGMISLDFTNSTKRGELILGNALLVQVDEEYPTSDRFHLPAHTLDRVLGFVERPEIGLPADFVPIGGAVVAAADVFLEYLMLDALVSNQDRHHQNWGVLRRSDPGGHALELAPTFDHASSLAFNLSDDERERRLTTKDLGYTVEAFLRKGESKLFGSSKDAKGLHQIEAFRGAMLRRPNAGRAWLARLRDVDQERCGDVVRRVPDQRMSSVAKKFALRILEINRHNLALLG